ncbi:hypothetical protein M440DRAFT_1035221 [Trichoderma longibrachiatum ATCC 18648]|uniref:Uncharacterized protein n=1 Tax=Trichoderma longibrachiatum ATCC 18648 TaxID=983965 RepID=A0A2T4BZN3_TRILO|nr:hypothetical protein M440DRAFT_1035221 [Trichoderma longibrachiatum ATCC 18648]
MPALLLACTRYDDGSAEVTLESIGAPGDPSCRPALLLNLISAQRSLRCQLSHTFRQLARFLSSLRAHGAKETQQQANKPPKRPSSPSSTTVILCHVLPMIPEPLSRYSIPSDLAKKAKKRPNIICTSILIQPRQYYTELLHPAALSAQAETPAGLLLDHHPPCDPGHALPRGVLVGLGTSSRFYFHWGSLFLSFFSSLGVCVLHAGAYAWLTCTYMQPFPSRAYYKLSASFPPFTAVRI